MGNSAIILKGLYCIGRRRKYIYHETFAYIVNVGSKSTNECYYNKYIFLHGCNISLIRTSFKFYRGSHNDILVRSTVSVDIC